MTSLSYRNTFLFLIAVQICYFSLIIFKGYVIYPHNNGKEILASSTDDKFFSNRKFHDESSVYIPAINIQLNGNHYSWLSVWNPHVQLGRPAAQFSGFSKAYLLTHFLSFFTKNPFRLYTVFTVVTLFLTSIFMFLFLKALKLHPIACAVSALALSTGIHSSYWLTFVMFLSTRCWVVCLLWLITEFINKKAFVFLVCISFATYSLFITGRLQQTILYLYLICAYTLIYLYKSEGKLKTKCYSLLMLTVCAAIGLIMTLPIFADLAVKANQSARLAPSDVFFLGVLPPIRHFTDLRNFLSSIVDPFWLGIPIKPDYPLRFGGFSLSPLYFGLFLMSFFNRQWRKLWLWQLFVILCLIAQIWPPGYLFMIHYLGFHLSRNQPLVGTVIPAFIICGFTIDYYLSNRPDSTAISIQVAVLISIPVLMGISAFMSGADYYQRLNTTYILICALIIAGLIVFVAARKTVFIVIPVIATVFVYGFSIMMTRPLETIHTSSELTKAIERHTSGGYRYAKIGPLLSRVIPSNQEAMLNLRSLHSYDSLSSKNYQNMVLQISEKGTQTYGRHFNYITSASKLSEPPFSYTGVNLLLFFTKSGLKFQKTDHAPILYAQTSNYKDIEDNQILFEGPLDKHNELQIRQTVSFDDLKKFKLTPSDSRTILFVSQQFHPQWKAVSNEKPLKTVLINDFYQGVVIPPGTKEVQLQFKPYVLWSWLPQLFFVVLIGIIGIKGVRYA